MSGVSRVSLTLYPEPVLDRKARKGREGKLF